jgi:GH35 family endo-1,4-beta-xylanase
MRKIKFAGFFIVILIASVYLIQAQSLPIPEGRRLRDIVEDKYPDGKLLVGATTGSWGFNEPIGEIMDREFSYVTPENDFKQSVVRNNPDDWNWSRADAWLQHIIENNQVLRIHGPISPQCSKWAKEDNRTAEELSYELDTFMTALCKRYNRVEGIKYLDVVNEVALSDGSWHHPKPGTDEWENPWLIIGQDDDPNRTPLYVKQAFAIADEHAPELKLIFNNHCHPGTAGMGKVKETVLYLREQGYRVDGLGWQAHVEVGWATEGNLLELRKVIDWCQERNLEFHVTEFDAWIMNKETQTLEERAYTYKAVMDVLLEKLDSLTIGWNTWHITDAAGWKTERIPSLFDVDYHPKPAYYALQQSLESGGDYTSVSGVRFENNPEEIHIFPNPASEWLNIQYESDFSSAEIINVFGITVDHFHFEESSNRIDISQLRNGYYWIKFSNPHNESHNIQPFIVW